MSSRLRMVDSGAALDEALERIMQRIDAQETELSALRTELDRRPTADAVNDLRSALTGRVEALEQRLERVERAIEMPSGDEASPRHAIGAAVSELRRRMGTSEQTLTATASRQQLQECEEAWRRQLEEERHRVDAEKATVELARTLHSSVEAVRRRVQAAEEVMAHKADTAQLAQVESAAAFLVHETDARERLRREVSALREESDRHATRLDEQGRRDEQVAGLLDDIAEALEERTTKGELEEVTRELRAMQHGIQARQRSQQSAGEEVQRQLDGLAARCDDLAQRHDRASQAQAVALERVESAARERAESAKASCFALEDGRDLQRAVGALEEETARRALGVTVEALETALRKLQQSQRATAEQVRVALDFVDWFASRGESYEYNASALEKHMNALAWGNAAKVADPARPPQR